MTTIFGLAGLNASDYQYVNRAGQRLIYDATNLYLNRANMDMASALSLFVEMTTTDFSERYKLPGGGRLQRRGGQAHSGAVKAGGNWTVAYPLEDFGAQVAATDVDMAYMSPQEYQTHVDTVIIQDINTVRYEMLLKIFKNTTTTFADEREGDLTIQTLANGDAVVYPPVLGSETGTTDNHYLESGYAAASISDSNNPLITIRDELEEHFGSQADGSNIVVFINNAQTTQISNLTDFDVIVDRHLRPSANVNVPTNLPTNLPSSAKVVGVGSGVIVVEWRWIPANYLVAIDTSLPAPLKMRVDPADTGLPQGLALVDDGRTEYPIQYAEWRHRFGFGVGNRLNGVVMELGTGGTYTIPTAYQ